MCGMYNNVSWYIVLFCMNVWYFSVFCEIAHFQNQWYYGRERINMKKEENALHHNADDVFLRKKSQMNLIDVDDQLLSDDKESPAVLFNAFDQMYAMVDDNIMYLHTHDNGEIYLEFGTVLPIVDDIIFIEVLEVEYQTFLLMAFSNGKGNLYISKKHDDDTWDKIELKQIVSNEKSYLVSAKFVILEKNIYLVIGYIHEVYGATDSIIYLWSGSYFDEIGKIKTIEVVDIAIIKLANSFIVALAQNSQYEHKLGILLYKYSLYDGLIRLSTLPVSSPSALFSYEVEGGKFLLVVNSLGDGMIYEISGDSITKRPSLSFLANVTCATISYLENYPIILLAGKNVLQIYDTYDERINTIRFSEDTMIDDLKISVTSGSSYNLVIFIICTNGDNVLIRIIKASISRKKTVDDRITLTREALLEKLGSVSRMLDERQNFIDEISNKIQEIQTIENVYYDGVLRLNHPLSIKDSVIGTMNLVSDDFNDMDALQINETMEQNEVLLNQIEDQIKNMVKKGKPTEIFEDAVFEGDVFVNNFIADTISTMGVNGRHFPKHNFSLNQYLSDLGDLEDIKLHVVNLTVVEFDEILDEELIVQSLTSNNVYVKQGFSINGVDPSDIVTWDFQDVIKGRKTFHSLRTINIEADAWNGVDIRSTIQNLTHGAKKDNHVSIDGNVTINQLDIEYINGVDVRDLLSNSYQKGIHAKIKGNLAFEMSPNIENIQALSYNGMPVDRMLTKTTSQNVTSRLTVPNMLLENAKVGKLNGLKFDEDFAVIGRDHVITTPVSIGKVITKNFILNYTSSDDSRDEKTPQMPERKLQIYEAPVLIYGNLTVGSLSFRKGAKLQVQSKEFKNLDEKMDSESVTRNKKPHIAEERKESI